MPQKQVIIVATEGDPSPSGLSPLAATLTTLFAVITLILLGWAGFKLLQVIWPILETVLMALTLLFYTTALGSKRATYTEEEKKTNLIDQLIAKAESKRSEEEGPLSDDTKTGYKIMAHILLFLMLTFLVGYMFLVNYLLFTLATDEINQIHPAVNILGFAATATATWWSFNGIRNFYSGMRILNKPYQDTSLLPFIVNKLLSSIVITYLVVVFLIRFGIL